MVAHRGGPFLYMPVYLNEKEQADLQNDIPSSVQSVHDLRILYYQNKTGSTNFYENDLIRDFLITQTGAVGVRSIRDLMRLYLIAQGVTNQVSLEDMTKEFFGGTGNPIETNTLGTIIGFPFGLTYAS